MGLSVGMVLSTGETVVEAATDNVADAFFHECRIWAHYLTKSPPEPDPHIARALSLRNLDDLGPVLFVSFVDGPPLSTLMRHGRQSLSQSIRMGAQIAAGLACAHARNVRHRDLKPSNILLTKANEIRLIDWGLARAQHETTLTAGVLERRVTPLLDDPMDKGTGKAPAPNRSNVGRMHHNANQNHAGSGPTAPWGLRGSPPQSNDDRPGEGGNATEQGRPEVVGRTHHNTNRCVTVPGVPVDLPCVRVGAVLPSRVDRVAGRLRYNRGSDGADSSGGQPGANPIAGRAIDAVASRSGALTGSSGPARFEQRSRVPLRGEERRPASIRRTDVGLG